LGNAQRSQSTAERAKAYGLVRFRDQHGGAGLEGEDDTRFTIARDLADRLAFCVLNVESRIDDLIEFIRDVGGMRPPAEPLPDVEALQREIQRLQDAKRRALALADERAKEAVELRLENERMRMELAQRPAPSKAVALR
jgi:hypothetical protein